MNEKEYKLVNKINSELNNLKTRLNIDNLEKIMNENTEVIRIKNEINNKTKHVEELLRYLSEDSSEVKKEIKDISFLKVELSSVNEVKNYNKAIKKYNEYIDYINKEIFNI